MSDKIYNVLFLCTGNSARSILAEAFLQALRYLSNRINLFLSLPFASIDDMAVANKLKEIGRADGASTGANE